MADQSGKINLLGLDQGGLEAFFAGIGEKPFRARQVMKWMHHHFVDDFEEMTDLSRVLREKLAGCAEVRPPAILSESRSVDGTVKWLMASEGGNAVETVFIPEPNRGTLCISSQVGCMLNCTFCATATQGFARNLNSAEIVGQVWQAARLLHTSRLGGRRITNVVLMGMGEPLLNLDAVQPALAVLRNELAFGLAAKRLTVSTAGVIPGIDRLGEGVDVALAISLHAPNDELRTRLVPLNRKYPIADLMQACWRFLKDRKRSAITFEYTLIDGVNDHPAHARALVSLLAPIPCKLNLIPFNPFPGTSFQQSSPERIAEFQEITRAGGIITMVRRTRGDDIDAACGQLAGQVIDRTRRQAGFQRELAARVMQ